MSTTGLSQFDETIQITNIWIKDLMEVLKWTERGPAYRALKVVMHEIRDRLPVALLAHLSAQLPMLLRGAFFESWQPGSQDTPKRALADFLAPIEAALERYPGVNADAVAAAVFHVMERHLSPGTMDKVLQALPKPVRDLALVPIQTTPVKGF